MMTADNKGTDVNISATFSPFVAGTGNQHMNKLNEGNNFVGSDFSRVTERDGPPHHLG